MALTLTREVTTIDQRTARRLGLSADKVNEVIRVWAEEYLRFEQESGWEGSVQQQALGRPSKRRAKSAAPEPTDQ